MFWIVFVDSTYIITIFKIPKIIPVPGPNQAAQN